MSDIHCRQFGLAGAVCHKQLLKIRIKIRIASFQKRFTIDCSVIQEDKKMEFNFASLWIPLKKVFFATLNDKKNELVKAGRKVYNMSVGTPDFKPAQHIYGCSQ